MTAISTLLVLVCSACFVLVVLLELFSQGAKKLRFLELGALVGFLLVLHLATGFPGKAPRQAFGGAQDLALAALLFAGILAGMAAHYFFHLEGPFHWPSLVKPFFVSPLILFPLVGTAPWGNQLAPIQWLSFGILAFQNGFFWRVIFDRVRKTA